MNKTIISKKAQTEIENALFWYENASEIIADRFIVELNNKLLELNTYPKRYSEKIPPYREVALKKFPFSIVYKYSPQKKIVLIISIFHFKRNPLKKYK